LALPSNVSFLRDAADLFLDLNHRLIFFARRGGFDAAIPAPPLVAATITTMITTTTPATGAELNQALAPLLVGGLGLLQRFAL